MSFMPTSFKDDDDYEPEFNVDELPTPTPEQRSIHIAERNIKHKNS